MLVTSVDGLLLALGVVSAYVLWEQTKILRTVETMRISLLEVMNKHNDLSEAFVELTHEIEIVCEEEITK
tara:strand:+ start:1426 stop:1635 length:210 start_codon:yes stop_codon:yes gene_type:complete